MSRVLVKMFGMRADTSAAIVRQLLTADKPTQVRVLAGIRMRLGRNRFEQLARIMEGTQPAALAISGRGAGQLTATGQ
jgi:hypothetical protein